jgi:hypothetical protein
MFWNQNFETRLLLGAIDHFVEDLFGLACAETRLGKGDSFAQTADALGGQ